MSEKERILFIDKIQEIEKSFIKDGWVTVYESNFSEENQILVYPCLISNNKIKSYRLHRSWEIRPSYEGKPSVWETHKNGKTIDRYQTYSDKGIEPFIFSKFFNFNGGGERYIDISEEFVLYFKLYEKGEKKQHRSFYYIDDAGDLEEVIKIEPRSVRVKLRYLKEYLAIRKYHLSICLDLMRFSPEGLSELKIEAIDQDFLSKNFFYNHLIRPSILLSDYKIQSWIFGKVIISPTSKDRKKLHFQADDEYLEYITGYDNDGNLIFQDCSNKNEKYFTVTYFKKEVLNKYYNDPAKYEVESTHIKSSFFWLKIDNNISDYIPVFLIELGKLPTKEQLHWKQYNIPPQNGFSSSYYKSMIEGSWAEHPETADLYFKYKYEDFNEKWKAKFGWEFYRPLEGKNKHRFTSLHIPTTNNEKAFYEQMLSLVIVTIDSLNEAEIGKELVAKDNEKGLGKLERFLMLHGADTEIKVADMLKFLRSLQDLRSGLSAHRVSEESTSVKRALDYFKINGDNYMEIANDIFIKSIYTLNSLEKHFL